MFQIRVFVSAYGTYESYHAANLLRTQWRHVFLSLLAAGFSHIVCRFGVRTTEIEAVIALPQSASQALGHPSAVRGRGIEGAAAGRALLVRGRELGAMLSGVCAARCARSRGLCAAIVDSRAM